MSARTRKEARKKARRAAAAADEAAVSAGSPAQESETNDLTQNANEPLEEQLQSLTLHASSPSPLPPVAPSSILESVCVRTTPKISLNPYTTVVIRSALMKGHSTATIGGGRVALEVVEGREGGDVGVKTAIRMYDDEASSSLGGGGTRQTGQQQRWSLTGWCSGGSMR